MLMLGPDNKIYDPFKPMERPLYEVDFSGHIRTCCNPMSNPIGRIDFTTNTIYDPINPMRPIGTIRNF